MPKPLQDQLDELEKQINFLLATQRVGDDNRCKVIRGKSLTRHRDGNVEEIEFEGTTCSPQTCKTKIRPVSSPPGPRNNKEKDGGCQPECPGDSQAPKQWSGTPRKTLYTFDITQNLCPCTFSPSPCTCSQPPPPKICPCKSKKDKADGQDVPSSKAGRQEMPGEGAEATQKRLSTQSDDGKKGKKKKGRSSVDGGKEEGAAVDGAQAAGGTEKIGDADKSKSKEDAKSKAAAQKETAKKNLEQIKEYEALLKQQQAKLKEMEGQLNDALKSKKMALSSANELKTKYEKLLSSKGGDAELQKLQKETEELANKLNVEIELKKTLEESAKKGVEKEKKGLMEQAEKVEIQTSKSAKKLQKEGEVLATAVKQKDMHIRRLSGTTDRLSDSMREKERENKKLAAANREINQTFMDAQSANKKLLETNDILLKSIKDFQDKLRAEKNLVKKMQQQIGECKSESQKFSDEVSRLKQRFKDVLQGPKDIKNAAILQAKLEESRERERKALEDAEYLQAQMQAMRNSQDQERRRSQDEIKRIQDDYKKLEGKYNEVVRILQKTKEEDERKIQLLRDEYETLSQQAEARKEQLLQEKYELQGAFDQLVENSQRDRMHLEDLIVLIEQHDNALEEHKDVLAAKEAVICALYEDIGGLRETITGLDNQVSSLQKSLKEADAVVRNNKRQCGDMTTQLQNEKENLSRKEQAIRDQSAKIQDMNSAVNDNQSQLQSTLEEVRMANEEAKKVKEKLNSVNEQLAQEQEHRKKLTQMGSEEARAAIAEKMSKVSTLLGTIDSAVQKQKCKCSSGDPILSKAYEQKAILMKQEAELQIQLAEKQKEHAVKAAKFATDMLMETATDFQNQIETHKKMQCMLTRMLRDKEFELKNSSPPPRECLCNKEVRPCACNK